MTNLQAWRIFAPLGLVLVGAGVSVVAWTAESRIMGVGFWTWFVWGTVGLALLNAGLAFFGESVKHRLLHELDRDSAGTPSNKD